MKVFKIPKLFKKLNFGLFKSFYFEKNNVWGCPRLTLLLMSPYPSHLSTVTRKEILERPYNVKPINVVISLTLSVSILLWNWKGVSGYLKWFPVHRTCRDRLPGAVIALWCGQEPGGGGANRGTGDPAFIRIYQPAIWWFRTPIFLGFFWQLR